MVFAHGLTWWITPKITINCFITHFQISCIYTCPSKMVNCVNKEMSEREKAKKLGKNDSWALIEYLMLINITRKYYRQACWDMISVKKYLAFRKKHEIHRDNHQQQAALICCEIKRKMLTWIAFEFKWRQSRIMVKLKHAFV